MKHTRHCTRQAAFTIVLVALINLTRAQEDCLDKGRGLFGQKKYKQAVMTLRKCDDKPDAQRLLGLAYFELNYMSDAQEYLQKAIKANPEEVNLKIKYAKSFALNRQFRKAVDEFRLLEKKYPDNTEITKELALCLGWKRDYDEAIPLYKKVLKKDPEDYESWIQVGVLTSWNKRFSEAVKIFDEIVAANPPREYELEARTHKAEVLSWMKKFDDAVDEYDKAIALEPKAINAYLGKGQVMEWQGKYKAAIRVYEEALQTQPGNKDAKGRLQQLMWVK